jgi:hypothetical protein
MEGATDPVRAVATAELRIESLELRILGGPVWGLFCLIQVHHV